MKLPFGSRVPGSDLRPAKNDSEAETRFIHSMNQALGLLTRSSQWFGTPAKYGATRSLVLVPHDVIPLPCDGELPLYFHGAVDYQFEPDQRQGHEGGRKVVVRGYVYGLRIGPDEAGEFLAWHWHPPDKPRPHLHVTAKHDDLPRLSKAHVPTSRVFLEDILIFAVEDLGARCRDQDTAALEEIRSRTSRWATWRAQDGSPRPPQP